MRPTRRPHLLRLAALLGCLSTLACQTTTIGTGYAFFEEHPESRSDPWLPKIANWQERERVDLGKDPFGDRPDAGWPRASGELRNKFGAFLDEHKRSLARNFAEWSQREARRHYRSDAPTDLSGDHWPTTKELLDRNGDDCDGLDLIAYNLLRESGFAADELFRLVVRRDRDGALHMVTLWFEERDDPWVIDTTGAMTLRMRKFSALPLGWTPVVMFNEDALYSVGR